MRLRIFQCKMGRLSYWCLIAALWLASNAEAEEWNDLRCRFSALDVLRLNSFFELPRTFSAAKEKGWMRPGETFVEKHLATLCEADDGRVCLLFDDKGSLAGYQIGIPRVVDALRMNGINYEEKGLTTATLFGEQFYIARAFFENPEYIHAGGRAWDGQTGTSLWLPIGGRLVEIPRNERDLHSRLPAFKKQNCYNKMGQHYFYNINRTMTPQQFQPFFILYSKSGDLIGWGFNGFGSKAVKKEFKEYIPFVKKRSWFESVPSSRVRDVAPDTPDWALKYLDDYGSFSHHVYMVKKPWNIEC